MIIKEIATIKGLNSIATGIFRNNHATTFDGINERVQYPDDVKYNFDRLTSFSFSARIKSNTQPLVSPIVYKYDKSTVKGVQFTYGNTGKLRLAIYGGSGLSLIVTSTNDVIFNGIPVHVAATYDGSATAAGVKLYINGASVPFDVITDGLVSGTAINTQPLYIGGQPVSIARYSDATMNEVRAWARELSLADIVDDYNLNVPKAPNTTNLVLDWRGGDDASFNGTSWEYTDGGLSHNMDLTNRVAAI